MRVKRLALPAHRSGGLPEWQKSSRPRTMVAWSTVQVAAPAKADATDACQRTLGRDITQTFPLISTSASRIRPPAIVQPPCPKDTRP